METQIIEAPRPATPAPLARHQQVSLPLAIVEPRPHLSAALATATEKCKAALKDSTNTFHRYKYASVDSVIDTAKEALSGTGLSIIPTYEELRILAAGNQAFYLLDRVLYLSHSSGENVPLEIRGWPVILEKGKTLDKAYAAALSTSLAYKLRDLLQMPRGDREEDISARDDRKAEANGHATQPEASEPQPATPVPATNQPITQKQRDELASIYRSKQRTPQDVQTMLASIGLMAMDQLPQSQFDWASAILTHGQVQTEQVDRITALIVKRGLPQQTIDQRLKEKYGVDRLRLLTVPQACEVEHALLGTRT